MDGVYYSDYVDISLSDNVYTVTFNNYNHLGKTNEITVTAAELEGFKHVSGDLDVVLTDKALNKLIAVNQDHDKTSVMAAKYNTLADYFFGNENITYLNSTEEVGYADKVEELWGEYCDHNIYNLTVGIFSAEDYELGIISNHAYTLKDLNDEYISLTNVWDTADVLNIDLNTFYNNMDTAVFVYGCDYYGRNVELDNTTSSPMSDISALTQDVISWQDGSGYADVQTANEVYGSVQDNYLAINSVLPEEF